MFHGSPRPSHDHLHVWLLVWCSLWNAVLVLCQMQRDTHLPKSSTYVASVHRIFAPKYCWYFLANVRRGFVFFVFQKWLYLGTLPWMLFLSSLFLIVESWTPILIKACEACSSLDVVLGSSMTSWMSRRCALGVMLSGRPLLERFNTLPSFLLLWITALTVIRWSPKALEMA